MTSASALRGKGWGVGKSLNFADNGEGWGPKIPKLCGRHVSGPERGKGGRKSSKCIFIRAAGADPFGGGAHFHFMANSLGRQLVQGALQTVLMFARAIQPVTATSCVNCSLSYVLYFKLL